MLYCDCLKKTTTKKGVKESMNIDLLKSVIVKNGDTQEKLAKFLGISLSSLNAKIHSRRSSFRQNEIMAIKGRYGLNADEIDEIFFTPKLS